MAVLLALFYLATSISISSHRVFWYDEIVTHNIATMPDYKTIWAAVTHAVDGGSPVYDAVVRISYQLFGVRDVVARIPSALAMVVGLLVVFDCARRLTDGLHGLIALAVLTCSFLPYYGHEARSYAIYFMLSASLLWIYVNTRENSRSAAILFGAVLFAAVGMHYYAVMCLVPYTLWEMFRWKPWKLPSPKLIGGVAAAVVAVLLLLPAILAFVPIVRELNPWMPVSVGRLRDIFSVFFPDGLWLLALIAIWIALSVPKDKKIVLAAMPAAEIIGWLFLCIPLAGFAAAELKTKSFGDRYFIGTLPGVAVAFSSAVWRHFHHARRVSLGILLILATWGVAKQAVATRHPNQGAPTPHDAKLESILRNDGKQFFVFANQGMYWQAYHYAKNPQEYAFLAPLDVGDVRLTMNFARYIPVQVWTLEDLRRHARESALIAPSPRVVNSLKQSGFKLEPRLPDSTAVFYLQ